MLFRRKKFVYQVIRFWKKERNDDWRLMRSGSDGRPEEFSKVKKRKFESKHFMANQVNDWNFYRCQVRRIGESNGDFKRLKNLKAQENFLKKKRTSFQVINFFLRCENPLKKKVRAF